MISEVEVVGMNKADRRKKGGRTDRIDRADEENLWNIDNRYK